MTASRLGVGYVAAAHGIAGTIKIRLFDPSSTALRPGITIMLSRRDADPHEAARPCEVATVDAIPGRSGHFRVGLAGVATRSEAEALRGWTIAVERDQLPPLAGDEFYLADTVGRSVKRRRSDGLQHLGTVVGCSSNGAQDLLEVAWEADNGRSGSWLMPVVPGFVIELTPEHMVVDVPHGMLPDELEEP